MKGFRRIAVALVLTVFPAVTFAATPLTQVPHNVPAALAKAKRTGAHNPYAKLNLIFALKLSHVRQLNGLLRSVQNPNSRTYHQFLTPEQFSTRYSPSQASVDALSRWLNDHGLRVTGVSSNHLLVHATGSTHRIEKVFGVKIGNYTLKGRSFYAATGNPHLPASFGKQVQAVLGLNNLAVLSPHHVANPHQSGHKGKPTGGGSPAGYSPQQIGTAYDWPAVTDANNGAGATLAIATAYTFKSSDVTGFWSQYGLPDHTVTIVSVDGKSHRTNTETTLDIERSGAMAPGATILVYEGANANLGTFTDVYNKVVTDDLASVMTTSWGLAESQMSSSTLQADHNIFLQAAAEGITVLAAAGDNGSSDGTSNNDEADYPSADPDVVACGGTTLNLNADNTIQSETAWSGTGGAESHVFSEPAWQTGNNVPQDGYRQTSDIALDANPNTGYSVLYNGRWSVYGGTSFVAPELAGLFAVSNARTGSRVGQGGPAIYADANGSNYSTDFHDITSGSNGAFTAGAYWDHPTGWGSIDASNLILHLQ